jgi:hypothetical protein
MNHKSLLLGGVVLIAALGAASYFAFFNGPPAPPHDDPNKPGTAKKDESPKKSNGEATAIKPAVYEAPSPSLAAATAFVHSGPQPVQTGLAPDALDSKRAAALRGLVFKDENLPFPASKSPSSINRATAPAPAAMTVSCSPARAGTALSRAQSFASTTTISVSPPPASTADRSLVANATRTDC